MPSHTNTCCRTQEEDNYGHFKLTIPLDASAIPDFKPDQAVRVAAEDSKGKIYEQVVKLDAKGNGSASFTFEAAPGRCT